MRMTGTPLASIRLTLPVPSCPFNLSKIMTGFQQALLGFAQGKSKIAKKYEKEKGWLTLLIYFEVGDISRPNVYTASDIQTCVGHF